MNVCGLMKGKTDMQQDGYKVPYLHTVEFRNILVRLALISIYWYLQYIKPDNMLFGLYIHAIVSVFTFISIFLNFNDRDKIIEKYELKKYTILNLFTVVITIYTLIIPLFSMYVRYNLAPSFSLKIDVIKFYLYSSTCILVGFGWIYYSKLFINKKRFYLLYGSFLQIIAVTLLLMTELVIFDNKIKVFEIITHNSEYYFIYIYLLSTIIFITNNMLLIKNHSKLVVSLLTSFINIILLFYNGFRIENMLSDFGWETLIISIFLCLSATSPQLEMIIQNQKYTS
jgi:hypothetical protein